MLIKQAITFSAKKKKRDFIIFILFKSIKIH